MDQKQRLVWADLAKGVSVVMVVLLHVRTKHYAHVEWDLTLPIRGAWNVAGDILSPMTMAVFFAISGYWAGRSLHRPGRLVHHAKTYYYLYVVWLTLSSLFFWLGPDIQRNGMHDGRGFLVNLLVATSHPWYLYALVVYLLAARWTRNLPAPAVLAGSAAVAALATSVDWNPALGNLHRLGDCCLFFFIGARLPTLVDKLASAARPLTLTVYGVAFSVLSGAQVLFDLSDVPGVLLLIGLLGIALALTAAVLAARHGSISRIGTYLGSRTLGIYVIHLPLLAIVHWYVTGPGSGALQPIFKSNLAAAMFPLVVTAALVAASLGIHALLLSGRQRWLFRPPPRLLEPRRRQERHSVATLPMPAV